jgi:outer membrane cobalamin receptor
MPVGTLFFILLLLLPAGIMADSEDNPSYQLDEVVFIATRSLYPLSAVPQDVQLVERRDLEAAGGKIEDALDRLPAVHVNRTGSSFMASLPTIRGSQPGQVLIMMDGRRLNSQQSGWFNLSDLPLPESLMERVEVLKGSSSALYGAEAMGGVINIIPRDPSTMPPAAARFDHGSLGGNEGEAQVSGEILGSSILLSAGRNVFDGYRANTDAGENRFNFHWALARDIHSLRFTADLLRKELGSPGPLAFPTPNARQWDDKNILGLAYEYIPSERVELDFDLFWNRYRREYDDPDLQLHSRHVTHTAGIDIQGTLERAHGRFLGGVEFIRDVIESTDDGEHHLNRLGAFLQDQWSPHSAWTVFLTGRYDYFSLFKDQFSPRAALVFGPAPGWSLRGSVARGYRTPTFDDLFWNDPFARGNPDLDPETSWSYELGALWEVPDRSRVNLNFFRRDVDDLINWQDEDGDWVFSPVNIATARIHGFSGDVTAALGKRFELAVNYTYLHPEDRENRKIISGRIRHLFNAGLGFSLPWVEGHLHFSWIDRYPSANLAEESYSLWSLIVGKIIPIKGFGDLKLSLEMENLLNEEYESLPGYPAPGRNVILEVAWTF